MLQREVADRLLARPATKDYGVLTVMTTMHARVDAAAGPAAGRVQPAAEGALDGRPADLRAGRGRGSRTRRCSSASSATMFSQRRKTLANALKGSIRPRPRCSPTPGSTAAGGRRRCNSQKLHGLRSSSLSARDRLCYSSAEFSSLFSGLPSDPSGRTPAGPDRRRARAAAVRRQRLRRGGARVWMQSRSRRCCQLTPCAKRRLSTSSRSEGSASSA